MSRWCIHDVKRNSWIEGHRANWCAPADHPGVRTFWPSRCAHLLTIQVREPADHPGVGIYTWYFWVRQGYRILTSNVSITWQRGFHFTINKYAIEPSPTISPISIGCMCTRREQGRSLVHVGESATQEWEWRSPRNLVLVPASMRTLLEFSSHFQVCKSPDPGFSSQFQFHYQEERLSRLEILRGMRIKVRPKKVSAEKISV